MNLTDVYGVGKPAVRKYIKAYEGCVSPDLVIGLELETEKVGHGAEATAKVAKPFNFMVETDGSLRGNAFEFISYPMRTDHCLFALQDFLATMKFGPDNYTDRCSVHVHVNCTDMEMEQISSLALLYTIVEEILFEFVGGHRESNIYCIPWNQCRQHLDLINRFLGDSTSVLKRWNKYTALNLLPLAKQGTVEFRQMHGTADMQKLSTWINIIGSLFKWAKTYELKVLIDELKALNSNSQYEAFFTKILSGTIPYNEVYREKLEQGVILAKFSLVNMDAKRNKPSAKVKTGTIGGPGLDWLGMDEAVPAAIPQVAIRPGQHRVAVDPNMNWLQGGDAAPVLADPAIRWRAALGERDGVQNGQNVNAIQADIERIRRAQQEEARQMRARAEFDELLAGNPIRGGN